MSKFNRKIPWTPVIVISLLFFALAWLVYVILFLT